MTDVAMLPKYPNYGIGKDGRIYSYKSFRWLSNKAKTRQGYPQIHLYVGGRPRVFLVHRLIAEAWKIKPSWATEVNHKNGDKTDNRASNLEWVTRAMNAKHAGEIGLMPVGSNHGGSKLSESDVLEIRQAYADGESQVSIARNYPVGRAMIGFIVRRESWQHV